MMEGKEKEGYGKEEKEEGNGKKGESVLTTPYLYDFVSIVHHNYIFGRNFPDPM